MILARMVWRDPPFTHLKDHQLAEETGRGVGEVSTCSCGPLLLLAV